MVTDSLFPVAVAVAVAVVVARVRVVAVVVPEPPLPNTASVAVPLAVTDDRTISSSPLILSKDNKISS